jgi:hypothetical protein
MIYAFQRQFLMLGVWFLFLCCEPRLACFSGYSYSTAMLMALLYWFFSFAGLLFLDMSAVCGPHRRVITLVPVLASYWSKLAQLVIFLRLSVEYIGVQGAGSGTGGNNGLRPTDWDGTGFLDRGNQKNLLHRERLCL